MSAPYLYLAPSETSYNVTLADDSISTEVEGGAARYRRDFLGSSNRATVQWRIGPEDRDFLVQFIEDTLQSGVLPFELDLPVQGAGGTGNGLTRHTVNVVPDSFRQTAVRGNTHTLRASLEVQRSATGAELRAAQALLRAASQGNDATYFAELTELANTTMPTIGT